MRKRLTTKEFIEKARKVHGYKYDYSKVEYKDIHTKVCIICHEHGEFWQEPNAHLQGQGCPECGGSRKLTIDEFVTKSNGIHNHKYDYSKVDYINNATKVCIVCTEHGEFWQTPHKHLIGRGCPKCGKTEKSNTNDFILKAKKIHGDKYDYSSVKYVNAITKVKITCHIHGNFIQQPSQHLSGCGCPKCGREKINNVILDKSRKCGEQFEEKSNKIHSNKYCYSKVDYINNRTKVCIICPKHGEFWQAPDKHLCGCGCQKCGLQMSKAEDEIIELLSDVQPQQRNREILNGKEIDIYIPQLKLGIEYNGLRWHSEEFGKGKHYHINKLNECNSKGVRLIQIFEDEWVNHREVCESKLKHICGLDTNKPKVFARKCSVREVTNTEAYHFLESNHIQGFASATVYLGCYTTNNQLVGVMNFKKEKDGYWVLNRFCTDINYNCIGIGSKFFNHFTQHYEFQEIKSFADRRWTTNVGDNLYTNLGFEFVEFTKPDYQYYDRNACQRHHKFDFRKQFLYKRYGLPITITEYEITQELGCYRIWDCGLIKYIYKK